MRGRRASLGHRCAAVLAAVGLTGCITPPVVAEAHREGWSLGYSRYPKDATAVTVRGDAAASGPALRGFFFPSDDGAPVVVHFAESGASLTSSMHARGQYHALAELGFASLVVDYRGVGLSDGEPSPRRLGEDAKAIWETALGLVEGDASRLVVRGASLGTVATSSLLAEGIEPAACIAFAPVRPKTVARLYGYALYWDPLVWLVAPFLRTFSSADPLDGFTQSGIPRLVVISPEDELLGERDFERLRRGVEASGGETYVPERLFVMILNDDPVMEALGHHIALTHKSLSVGEVETDFLRKHFPSVPDVRARFERIARLGAPEGVEALDADPALRRRADVALGQHRLLPPNLVLAAAKQLSDDEMQAFDGWFMKPFGHGVHDTFVGRSYARLLELLDLEDPGGRLPIELVVEARKVLGLDLDVDGGSRWSPDRLDGLFFALRGRIVAGHGLDAKATKPLSSGDWKFGVVEGDHVPYALPGESGKLWLHGLQDAHRADAEGRSEEEAGTRLYRCLYKAAGFPLTLVPRAEKDE